MKIKDDKISTLIENLEDSLAHLYKYEDSQKDLIQAVNPYYKRSARNLVHYNALRKLDFRPVQKRLRNLGMSRLANAGSHVEASLIQANFILKLMLNHQETVKDKPAISIKGGKKKVIARTKDLLGRRFAQRRVRIMVTQPTEAAYNYDLVYNMVKAGMDCARINCAHDDELVWGKIIDNVKKAAEECGRTVKIAMDLAGPKIRTGSIEPGPRIRRFRPKRDIRGKVVSPAEVLLVPALNREDKGDQLAFDPEWLDTLKEEDVLSFADTRGAKRKIIIVETSKKAIKGEIHDTTYIESGIKVKVEREGVDSCEVGELPAIEQYLRLVKGDELLITKDNLPGKPAVKDKDGNTIKPAQVSCQIEEVFEAVKEGEPILFDDGKITAKIKSVQDDSILVTIKKAKEEGVKLKMEKGMNFPKTALKIHGLTRKDKEDLKFVAANADIVNFSFVNSKEDVSELIEELDRLEVRDKLSVILKIETRFAYLNLKEMLLEAMKIKYVGVMIARGDLAVETGWDEIGKIQDEILSLCDAAHVPVVWATQVLENMAKKGLPSRSEITDATSSLRAECVMLNKGAYILDAIELLDKILCDMESFHEKNEPMLPKLTRL